jgi:hypothetical protein
MTDPRSMVRPICLNKDYEFLGHGLGLAGPLDRLIGAPTTGLKAKKALGGNRHPKKRGAVSKGIVIPMKQTWPCCGQLVLTRAPTREPAPD